MSYIILVDNTMGRGWPWDSPALCPKASSGPIDFSVVNRLIRGGPEIASDLKYATGLKLIHDDADELLGRVNPEVRTGGAGPPVFSRCAEHLRLGGIKRDAYAKAETKPRIQPVRRKLLGREMIGRHQFDGLPAQYPLSLKRSAVQKHLAESVVIHCGGYQPVAAAADMMGRGFHSVSRPPNESASRCLPAHPIRCGHPWISDISVPVLRRKSVQIVFRDIEPGVDHAEWRKDVFLKEGIVVLTTCYLNDPSHYIVGRAVPLHGPRLKRERHLCQVLHKHRQRILIENPRLPIHSLHTSTLAKVIRET